jgi:hypothetical protein
LRDKTEAEQREERPAIGNGQRHAKRYGEKKHEDGAEENRQAQEFQRVGVLADLLRRHEVDREACCGGEGHGIAQAESRVPAEIARQNNQSARHRESQPDPKTTNWVAS